MNKAYWVTKDGKVLDVDEITDINHLRNIVKMQIRNGKILQGKLKKLIEREEITLNGDMAQEFNDTFPDHDEG
jgi:hypothetical protein